ncbi:hypothetical protein CUV01_00065 [Paracoccus tegillarcae]|uniref:Uncharacterized protein n=1 Tax=Paracoccus tegillarcae TaxID=1529068 RepID=A0A2K9EAU6_9RHOB|nr:hypothetical protein CUV01_00065 [Paracoccus tegillarcae]
MTQRELDTCLPRPIAEGEAEGSVDRQQMASAMRRRNCCVAATIGEFTRVSVDCRAGQGYGRRKPRAFSANLFPEFIRANR